MKFLTQPTQILNAGHVSTVTLIAYVSFVMAFCGALVAYCRREQSGDQLRGDRDEAEWKTLELPVSRFMTALGFGWSLLLGVLVTLQADVVVKLNDHATNPRLHALSASFFITSITAVVLSLSYFEPAPIRRPPFAACLAGVCTMLTFTAIVAGTAFGFEVTLAFQMMGSLVAALIIDYLQNPCVSMQRIVGTGVVFIGALLIFDARDHEHETMAGQGARVPKVGFVERLCLLLVVVSGGGYAVQSRCNVELRLFLGSPFRAAFLCHFVTLACWAPILLYGGLHLEIRPEEWYLWLLCSAQNLFHTVSMSVLPHILSYSATFTALVTGQLVSAAVVDFINVGSQLPSARDAVFCVCGLVLATVGAAAVAASPKHAEAVVLAPSCKDADTHKAETTA